MRDGFLPAPMGFVWVILTGIWLTLVSLGLGGLAYYSLAPGRGAEPPPVWMDSEVVPRSSERPTLVMLVHPRCACSRASLSELALLMARVQGRVNAHVLMARPEGAEAGWEETLLWRQARAIPGVRVSVDEGGEEARRMGAWTSGNTVLYDASGRLMFGGGITASRGHEGGNAGRSAIEDLIVKGSAERSWTPVFGCQIFEETQETGVGVRREAPRRIGSLESGSSG